jgi:hypothetical protein
MITVISNFKDFQFLSEKLRRGCEGCNLEFYTTVARLFGRKLQRRFIIFDTPEYKDEFEELCEWPFIRLIRNKGRLHFIEDAQWSHLEISGNCRVIELNNNDAEQNEINSKNRGHICLNVRDERQIIYLDRLFESDSKYTKGFRKDELREFPLIKLPTKDVVFFDPYFPKGLTDKNINALSLDDVAIMISKFFDSLVSNGQLLLGERSCKIHLVVREGLSSLTGLSWEQLSELEELVIRKLSIEPLSFLIVICSGSLHDRGIIGDYFKVGLSNSIASSESEIEWHGILDDFDGYFLKLQMLNNKVNGSFEFLGKDEMDLGRALGI